MSICKLPDIVALRMAAADTPAAATKTLWYRAVAAKLDVKTDVVSRLCRELAIPVPERVGVRRYFKGG